MIVADECQGDDQSWSRLTTACDGNPLHWEAITAAEYPGSDAHYIVLSDVSCPVACALGYTQKRRRWRFFPAGRDLEFPTPPAIARHWCTPEGELAIYRALVRFARNRGYSRLIVHPRFGHAQNDLAQLAPFRTDPLLEFVVDLQHGWDAVLGGMHRFHRKNIRRAERDGLDVVSDPSIAGLLQLRDLQLISSRRSAKRGGGFRVRDREYFEKIHSGIYSRGLGDVLFARSGQEVMAGLAYVAVGNCGITVRSGATLRGYQMNALYLLHEAALRIAQGRGLREINIGGVPAGAKDPGHAEHGLYEFKRGFGGAERALHRLEIPLQGNPLATGF